MDKLGVWIRKSTKTDNVDEAREFAEEKWVEAKILAQQGHPVLSKNFRVVAEAVLIDLHRKIAASGNKRGSNNYDVSAIQTYLIPFFSGYIINRIAQLQINEFHE